MFVFQVMIVKLLMCSDCLDVQNLQLNLLLFLHAAYKLTVKSSAAEGDFMTYRATVDEVLKNSQGEELESWTRTL